MFLLEKLLVCMSSCNSVTNQLILIGCVYSCLQYSEMGVKGGVVGWHVILD